MRRIHGLAIILMALLLLGVAAARTIPAAGHPSEGATATDVGALAATTDDPGYTRKLPPPADSVKPAPPAASNRPSACSAPVVNVSALSGNEDESYVVVNPNNTNNIVAFSNLSSNSIFRAYTMNGGTSWTRGTVVTNVACCDGQAAFDTFGNLFMVYLNTNATQVNMVLSTDGGVTFGAPVLVGSGSVDQPSIAVGNGSVWVDWNLNGNMQARGAPVTGLGAWGPFNAAQTIPTGGGSFGGIAVGPGPNGGKVMVAYQSPTSGEGPATIFVNTDADGLGAGTFGARITATTTNVGGFDFIPAQSGRSIDAEAGLVWDPTAGPFNNRAYLVYTEEPINENNDTEIYVRTSTNDGTTWSAPVRVNDDALGPIRSQFLPYITLDRSTGTVAIGWQDSRNDNGVPGSGGTNAIPNDDAEFYASYSTNGGVTWAPNQMLSGGFSNDNAAAASTDYGDYEGQDAAGGKFVAVWADNTNCDGTNPNGTLHAFDLYMGTMALPAQGTPTPTRTGTPPTVTRTATPTNTVPPSNTPTATLTACAVTSYVSTDVPRTICDLCTITSTLTIPAGAGTIADIDLTGLSATHTWISDMIVSLTSPSNTTVVLINRICGSEDNFTNITLDDSAAAPIGSSCPPTPNGSFIPANALAAFAGQAASGTWILTISDNAAADTGNLTAWGLRVSRSGGCGTNTPTPPTTATATSGATNTVTVTPNVTATRTATRTATPGGTVVTGTATPTTVASVTSTAPPTTVASVTSTAPPTTVATSTAPPTVIPTTCPVQFQDVLVGSTFYEFIRCLACRGIVTGYPCGGPGEPCPGNYFRPNNNVTRGQVSKIVSESAGFNNAIPSTQWTFQDVPPSGTFWLWVERLSGRGIIGGYPCGGALEPCVAPGNRPYFRPNNDVTRGQLSKIVSGAAGWTETPTGQTFQDVTVGSTFYTFIERVASRGIVAGYPCGNPGEPCVGPGNKPYFRPNNNATRGQMSKIAASAFFPGCSTPARR